MTIIASPAEVAAAKAERPVLPAGISYAPVGGTLTQVNKNNTALPPSYLDVEQGAEGDCWLLASLAEAVARDSTDISKMFNYDGSTVEDGATVGIFTIRVFNTAGVARYVTVDTELPVQTAKIGVNNPTGTVYDHPVNSVLWVALAEKVYAEANGFGYVTTSVTNVKNHVIPDSYAALNEGSAMWALQAITGSYTGYENTNSTNVPVQDIPYVLAAGNFVVILSDGGNPSSPSPPPNSDIVTDHWYAVISYTASYSHPFQIFNPWGSTLDGMDATS